MIITCEKCATRFRLDESLLKADGSKVRCSLCKLIFTAFPPLPDAGLDLETESLSARDMPFDSPEDMEPGSSAAPTEPSDIPPEPRDTPSEPSDWQPEPGESETDDFEPDSLDFDDTDFEEDLQQEADIEISFEDEDSGRDLETGISFDAEDEKQDDFDSDDLELEAIDPDDLQLAVDSDEPDLFSGLEMDLASDDLDENKQTFDEQDLEKDDLDIQEMDKKDRLDPDGLEADIPSESRLDHDELLEDGPETDELDALNGFDDDEFHEKALDDTGLDDTDLDKSDPHKHSPDAPPARRPARASLIQPLGAEGDAAETTEASSKKQPALGTPVLILLLIFLLAAGSYVTATILGYKIPFLPEIKIPFVQQHLSQKSPESLPAPDPVPDQKSVTGRFITNDTSGELFIITGKIENPAQIPYRHIQVKGTLFQKEKIAAMTQIAYCGHIVPEDVLKTGNIDDITAQLKIPRGAADITAKVMPGDTVPFMLVFSDLPQNLENFTVEVTGFEKTTP